MPIPILCLVDSHIVTVTSVDGKFNNEVRQSAMRAAQRLTPRVLTLAMVEPLAAKFGDKWVSF